MFCSRECRGKFVHKNGAYWLDKDRGIITCKICGDSFKERSYKQQYCSFRCSGKAKKWVIKYGVDNPTWKGGISPIHAIIRQSLSYKEWRQGVFERDHYICQHCGQLRGYIEADHIKPFANFPELRFDISNGRTLCHECHRKTETYGRKTTNFSFQRA